MSTNKPSGLIMGVEGGSQPSQPSSSPQQPSTISSPNAVSNVQQLVSVLQTVNTATPEAEMNQTSISDGRGGRIELDENGSPTPALGSNLLHKEF